MTGRRAAPTQAELSAVRALREYGTVRAAAGALCVSPHTVDSHIDSLRGKTGLRRTSQILALAAELGWFESTSKSSAGRRVRRGRPRKLASGVPVCVPEEGWEAILTLIETSEPAREDDRQVLAGILYVLSTGCAWNRLPPVYGSHYTCWRRWRRWREDGTWIRLAQALLPYGLVAVACKAATVPTDGMQ